MCVVIANNMCEVANKTSCESKLERFLRNLRPSLPPERWEQRVLECVGLMNRWFKIPHWDYDRDNLCFVEIISSRPYRSDSDDTEEPAPDSISQLID